MRTIGELISSEIRAVGRRISRSLRAGIARVRGVLKRVRGGLSHHHLTEVSICAPAAPMRVCPEKAASKPGLPMEAQDVTARVSALRGDVACRQAVRIFQKNTTSHTVRWIGAGLDPERNQPSLSVLVECAALIPPYDFTLCNAPR